MDFQHWTNHYIFEKATAIFIFMLIISGNSLAELFPCRIQKMLKEEVNKFLNITEVYKTHDLMDF